MKINMLFLHRIVEGTTGKCPWRTCHTVVTDRTSAACSRRLMLQRFFPMLLGRYACLNKMYSKVRIGKHWSDSFPIQNGLKQGDVLM
jgi:hypothetical protein